MNENEKDLDQESRKVTDVEEDPVFVSRCDRKTHILLKKKKKKVQWMKIEGVFYFERLRCCSSSFLSGWRRKSSRGVANQPIRSFSPIWHIIDSRCCSAITSAAAAVSSRSPITPIDREPWTAALTDVFMCQCKYELTLERSESNTQTLGFILYEYWLLIYYWSSLHFHGDGFFIFFILLGKIFLF